MPGSHLFWLIWLVCISIWIIQFCLFSCFKEYKGPWYACQVVCCWAIPHPYMEFRNWGQFFRKGSYSHCGNTVSLFIYFGVLSCFGFLFVYFVFFRTRDRTLGLGKQSTTELHPGFIVVLLIILYLSIQWHRLLSHSFGLSWFFFSNVSGFSDYWFYAVLDVSLFYSLWWYWVGWFFLQCWYINNRSLCIDLLSCDPSRFLSLFLRII